MWFCDVYVLCEDRSPFSFEKFRSAFLTDAEESAEEYYFPRFSDNPQFVTNDLSVILDKLFQEKDAEFSIYWNAEIHQIISSPMMFFTDDGYVIYGLAVREDNAENMIHILKKMFSSEIGGITFEMPPPLNSKEFIRIFCDNK